MLALLPMNAEFYDHIKVKKIVENYCREHRISEADFAALLDVHSGHLPRIKKGEMCSVEILGKIAALGRIPLKDLILDTPERLKKELSDIGSQKNIAVSV